MGNIVLGIVFGSSVGMLVLAQAVPDNGMFPKWILDAGGLAMMGIVTLVILWRVIPKLLDAIGQFNITVLKVQETFIEAQVADRKEHREIVDTICKEHREEDKKRTEAMMGMVANCQARWMASNRDNPNPQPLAPS